jgi:hypothetical protein
MGSDAFAPEANGDGVRIGIRATNLALRLRFVDLDLFDDFALLVVETAEKRPGSK